MRYAMLIVSVTSALLSTGCLGGGGGGNGLFSALSDFFNGSSSSSSSNFDILGSLPDGGGTDGSGPQIASLSIQGDGGVPDVATLHNPEPASMMLFGSGLAGAALLRRRRARRAARKA